MKRTWTKEQIDLLVEKYPKYSPAELKNLFSDKTATAIRSKAKSLSLKKENKKFFFSEDQINFLKQNYSIKQNSELASLFSCSIHTIENKAHSLGLKKNIEFIRELARERSLAPDHGGRRFLFTKGHLPMNKGKRQEEYMSQQSIDKTKATRFKKGHTPKNHKPVGYERITVDGYIEIKVNEPNVFKLKHRVVWEDHYGPIPKDHNIQFKDGNPLNCEDISNLYMISRANQIKLENSVYARYPEEIAKLIQLKGALKRQLNKRNTINTAKQ